MNLPPDIFRTHLTMHIGLDPADSMCDENCATRAVPCATSILAEAAELRPDA
ncbi:MAG: hypothetical protein LC792_23160 [Actinobacteria bacterium]|nr:hypothetical protein [Actinomycetota bacterium]